MKISHVLTRAAKLVERHGWCRGMRDGARRCAYAAISDVQGVTDIIGTPAYRFFVAFSGARENMLGVWNDHADRTGPEVACWLSSAAEWAKVRGR